MHLLYAMYMIDDGGAGNLRARARAMQGVSWRRVRHGAGAGAGGGGGGGGGRVGKVRWVGGEGSWPPWRRRYDGADKSGGGGSVGR